MSFVAMDNESLLPVSVRPISVITE